MGESRNLGKRGGGGDAEPAILERGRVYLCYKGRLSHNIFKIANEMKRGGGGGRALLRVKKSHNTYRG